MEEERLLGQEKRKLGMEEGREMREGEKRE